jgi:hypothetical protein
VYAKKECRYLNLQKFIRPVNKKDANTYKKNVLFCDFSNFGCNPNKERNRFGSGLEVVLGIIRTDAELLPIV